jgi:hypothetical protein
MPGIAEIEIPKHYVPMFKANIDFKPQQSESLFRDHVTTDTATGEAVNPVQIFGKAKTRIKTDRYGDTPLDEIDRYRPWVFPLEIEGGDLIDKADVLKQVIDPTSPLVMAFRMALGEDLDTKVIIPAFFGPRFEGKDVATAVTNGPIAFVDATYKIASTVGSAGGATPVGMNLSKIKAGIKKFKQLKAIRGNVRKETIKLGINAQQWDELFEDVKLTSSDYINGVPLERGNLPLILGVDFVESEELPRDPANGNRWCPMWLPSGINCTHWQEDTVAIGPDPGKRFNIRVYVKKMAGAARIMDEKVLKIDCVDPS